MAKKPTINRKALAHDIAFHAGRIECKADHDYLNASAVAMSLLSVLRNYADYAPLTADDITVAIDAAFAELGLEEKTTAMGATYYTRKGSTVPQPLGPALADGGPGDLRVK